MLESLAVRWVRVARRAWPAVLALALLASAGAAVVVRGHLGIHTDTTDMLSPSLDWRQRYIDFSEQFPQFTDTLVIVVDAATPDLASLAAGRLAASLSSQPGFRRAQVTGDDAFFRRHALLYLDAPERARLVDDLVAAQPLLGRLARDPGLDSVLALLIDALTAERDVDPAMLERFASRLAAALEATARGEFHRLSWRALLAGESAGDARRIVVAAPAPDYRQLFPAADAIAAVRDTARRLRLDAEHGVRVRVTGGLAMSDEELRTVSRGAGRAALLALVGVTVVLMLGLGSVRLVLASVVTLLAGLLWTAAFAALAVGHLNMISVAFAVLYIGLGVDYAVHFGLRYRELHAAGQPHGDALEGAAADVGGALALCALTTGAGFFAFLPTSFAGVSELGLIAGVGMFVSLAATLTLMPALLTLMRPRGPRFGRLGVGLPVARALDALGERHPRRVVAGAAALAALAAVVASQARFDDNPLNLRDPDGEAVATYRELVAQGEQWALDVLVAGEEEAGRLAARLEQLPQVRRVVWLADLVPPEQDAALAQVEELALLLGPDLMVQPPPPGPPRDAVDRLRRIAALLDARAPADGGLGRLRSAVTAWLDALQQLPVDLPPRESSAQGREGQGEGPRRARVDALQAAVTGTLPAELGRLADLLDASPVTPASLPPSLVRDWRAADGRLRLRVDAAGDLNRPEALQQFADAVREQAPGAIGSPVINLEAGRAVVRAFVEALGLSLVCIALILLGVLRRPRDVALALAPLLLAALLSAAAVTAAGVPFNFANVIALPLLLGVGVDSGIHMLTRARMSHGGALAGSSTARGVLTSALTTTVSFGNLAFSGHPGTASMGVLLTVGMVATLLCTLLVLPALVRLAAAHGPAAARGAT